MDDLSPSNQALSPGGAKRRSIAAAAASAACGLFCGSIDEEAPSSGDERPPAVKGPRCWDSPAASVAIPVAVWWTAAVLCPVALKRVTGEDGSLYPYPFAFTAIVNLLVCPITVILGLLLDKEQDQEPVPWSDVLIYLAIGSLQGISIGCANKALEFATVTTRTMVNATAVLFMMLSSKAWRVERIGRVKMAAGLLVTLGGILEALGQGSGDARRLAAGSEMLSSGLGAAPQAALGQGYGVARRRAVESELPLSRGLFGVLVQMTAMLFSTQYWVLMQHLTQRESGRSRIGKMSKLRLTSRVTVVISLNALALSAIFEAQRGAFDPDSWASWEVLQAAVLVSAAVAAILCAELKLVASTGAVTLSILSSVHQIPIVLAGALILGDAVSLLSLLGFGCCLTGGVVYARQRQREKAVAVEEANEPYEGGSRHADDDDAVLGLVRPVPSDSIGSPVELCELDREEGR